MYNHRKAKSTMHRKNGKIYPEKPQDIYQCSAWKLDKTKFVTSCSAHHIQTKAVRDIILTALRKTSGYVREHEEEFVELVRQSSVVKQGETAKSYKKQITKNERRIAELGKIFRSLYEDKALGKLPEERFDEMTSVYEQEQSELKVQNEKLQAEIDEFNADSVKADKFIEMVRKYTRFEELIGTMINEFIDKVIIHEGVWSECDGLNRGTRTQQVDVYLKYIGKFDVPETRTQEEIEAERLAEEKLERERKRRRENARRLAEKRKAEEQAA
jgi:hypothetical protein